MNRETEVLFNTCVKRATSIGHSEYITSGGTFYLPDILKLDFLNLLVYVALKDGSLEDEEIKFINSLLGYNFSREKILAYAKKNQLDSDECLKEAPRSLPYFVKANLGVDLTIGLKYYDLITLYTSTCQAIGREMVACNRYLSSVKIECLTQYGIMLEVHISEIQKSIENTRYSVPFRSRDQKKETVREYDINDTMKDVKETEEKKTEDSKEDVPFTGTITMPEEGKTFDMLYDELMRLTGLESVKQEVGSLINLLKITKLRQANGLSVPDIQKHMVFLGNPGTGKTTIARLLAQIYASMGILSKGQLVEVDRSGLVAGYMGQTAEKVNGVVNRAIGGVLFIDEAYALTSNKMEGDFGQEAVDVLNKAMEDHRDDLIVIVAGYNKEMQTFLDANPGLRSRFSKTIDFPDYTPDELIQVLVNMADKLEYKLTEDAVNYTYERCKEVFINPPKNFGNARTIRNYLNAAIGNQANRLMKQSRIDREALMGLTKEDFMESDII